ncbi:MAG: hypothetical protein M1829_006858 [Trizodia sp. TS-e1964]|nr:MAG: hypothetical protein M1829_006858 [Trizodia sp. TS-e1964]
MVQMKSSYDDLLDGGQVWGTASLSGPFESTKAYLLAMLNNSKIVAKKRGWIQAHLSILHQAIDSIPASLDTPKAFSLGHSDFNYQNIFTDDDGSITGLIDRDSIHILPRALAFARYPCWITRDWDPANYSYDKPGFCNEDSPA